MKLFAMVSSILCFKCRNVFFRVLNMYFQMKSKKHKKKKLKYLQMYKFYQKGKIMLYIMKIHSHRYIHIII